MVAVMFVGGNIACGFDTSGLGSTSGATPYDDDDGSTGAGTGTEGSGSTAASAADADGDGGSADGATQADSADDAGSSGSTTANDTTPDMCADPPPVIYEFDISSAFNVQPPMQTANHPDEGEYAYSEVAGQGKVSFEFTVPCEAEFYAFARVHDPGVGASGLDPGQPDSYYVAFDGDTPAEWLYGCQTFDRGFAGPLWSWVRIVSHAGCFEEDFRRTLGPGVHFLHLTNREEGEHQPGFGLLGNVAAVSRVIITNDPAYVPP